MFSANQRMKKIIEWATGDPNYVDDMQVYYEDDVKVVLSQEDLYNIENEIRTAYELGYQEATQGISFFRKQLKHDPSEEIDLDLLIAVCNQIQEDVTDKDYTAIECLFQYLDDPEDRLKGFLREEIGEQ